MTKDQRRILIAGGGPVGLLCAWLVHRNLYVTHQRVAETFRKGRVLLNPIGGMGLNGGIQDAVSLADKLVRIVLDGESERLLDLYDLQQRTVAIEFLREQTIANKKRLEAADPDVRKRNLDDLRATAADPERARQFLPHLDDRQPAPRGGDWVGG